MEMYNVHQDALMLPVEVTSNDYTLGDKKLKAVSASASKDKSGAVHISLVNMDPNKGQDVNIDMRGLSVRSVGRCFAQRNCKTITRLTSPIRSNP
jgi:alpha-N-arabinofuranosidase